MRFFGHVVINLLVIVTSLIGIELFSFLYLFVDNLAAGQPVKSAYISTVKLNPVFSPRLFFGNYDPLHRQYLEPDRKFDSLIVNKWGFIGNGHDDRLLDRFPDKPRGVYRIVLFGGSSGAGVGASSNASTIAAQLEKTLNAHARHPTSSRFQVLNYGIPGSYTFYELTKYVAEASYLRPDLVVFLDGWNDFITHVMESSRFHVPHGMVNWDYLAHQYFELLHGVTVAPDPPPHIFTWSYIVAKKLTTHLIAPQDGAAQVNRLKVYEHHPLFDFSAHIMQDAAFPGNVYSTNAEAMAAFSIAKGITFLHYLQPYPQLGKILTSAEVTAIEELHAQYEHTYGPDWALSVFTRRLNEAYIRFQTVQAELAEKYKTKPHVKFYDITNVFSDIRERTYADIIHYNDRGQELLARRIGSDIQAVIERPR